jgi:Recombination endonuclease VII
LMQYNKLLYIVTVYDISSYMKPISRKTAEAQGLTRYYTGRLCEHGHRDERSVADGRCVVCTEIAKQKFLERTTDDPSMANKCIISCQEAKSLGLIRFFTGVPCIHGHLAERYVSNNMCVPCKVLKVNKIIRRHIENKTSVGLKIIADQRKHRLRIRYGITEEQYDAMLLAQGNKCAICKKDEATCIGNGEGRRRLAVDHDHATGAVRGLLCTPCNNSLGVFENRKTDFQEYLRRSRPEEHSPAFWVSFAIENGAVPI